MTFFKWSKTASTNATADSSCPFPEGMAPSALNDGTRGMMAAAAKYRDDTNGSIVAGGTSSAYTISSNQGFSAYSDLRLQEITFICPATNAAGVTLNVDGTGAQPINGADTVALPAGSMVAGGVYTVTAYTGEFILHSYVGGPTVVPIGAVIDFFGAAAPSGYAFPNGQAVSRTIYATLFALVGVTYGSGDGSTTFNLPDVTGRVTAMKEASASRLNATYFGGDSTALGAVGGLQSHTLTLAELPTGIASSGTGTASVGNGGQTIATGNLAVNTINASLTLGSAQTVPYLQTSGGGSWSSVTALTGTSTASVTSTNTSGSAHAVVQPTIICNKIMRII